MEQDRVLLALRLRTELGQSVKTNGLDLAKLFKDAEESARCEHCIICKAVQVTQADLRLEEHHVAGRARRQPNLPDTVTVCSHHHSWLNDHQRAWLLCSTDSLTRLSSYYFGWADVFDLMAKESGLLEFEKLAKKFRAQGAHIRNHPRRQRETSYCLPAI